MLFFERKYNRLESWKSWSLSKAGRLTLIQEVLCNIPINYKPLLFKMPSELPKRIDKLNRDFLWKPNGW